MKKVQKLGATVLLTLALTCSALAGNISAGDGGGSPTPGNISAGNSANEPGNISAGGATTAVLLNILNGLLTVIR